MTREQSVSSEDGGRTGPDEPVAPPVALTIAGSDSGGGAGVQADLKTFHAFGVFGTSAITAVTAQDTHRVYGFQTVDPDLVAQQIRAVAEDLRPAAAKTGMLADARIIEAVASALERTGIAKLVVDPVMMATSGDRLLEASAEHAYLTLFPLATVVTPNLREAEMLTGSAVTDLEGMCEAAQALIAMGCGAVLIKGGHLPGEEILDLLHDGTRWHVWRTRRIGGNEAHGTGCTLSAAITAGLAHGERLFEAVDAGLRFTRDALRAAPRLGGGHRPLSHWARSGHREPPGA